MVHIPCNVGGSERTARIGVGAVLLGLGALAPFGKPFRIAAGALGAVGLITGLINYCPLNLAIHRNTCPTAHQPHE